MKTTHLFRLATLFTLFGIMIYLFDPDFDILEGALYTHHTNNMMDTLEQFLDLLD